LFRASTRYLFRRYGRGGALAEMRTWTGSRNTRDPRYPCPGGGGLSRVSVLGVPDMQLRPGYGGSGTQSPNLAAAAIMPDRYVACRRTGSTFHCYGPSVTWTTARGLGALWPACPMGCGPRRVGETPGAATSAAGLIGGQAWRRGTSTQPGNTCLTAAQDDAFIMLRKQKSILSSYR
jgi:hypothetical protein